MAGKIRLTCKDGNEIQSDEVVRCDLDGSLPLWVFPAEVGQAEHCQPDRQLGGGQVRAMDVGDQSSALVT